MTVEQKLMRSTRRNLLLGAATVVLLVGGVGSWAATTDITGAVAASGSLVIDGSSKKVQHPTGGVIAELLVGEGQMVSAGDVVIRLDATVTRANIAAISKKLNHLLARQARLASERDGLLEVRVPDELLARLPKDATETLLKSERRLFSDRQASRDGQKARLREQIGQLRDQIRGLDMQQHAKSQESLLIGKELEGQRQLFQKGLTSLNRLNNLERDGTRLAGEHGQLLASIAATKGRITEIELQLLQIDQTMRTEVATEARDVANQLAELAEQETAGLDQLRRIDIVAPATGTVHRLAIHTVGGVINPAETLMEIVPEGAALTVETRIQPQDIDQLSLQQDAVLHLTAFNRNTTPELNAKLIRVSADLEFDEKTAMPFYRAAMAIPDSERSKISDIVLVPGMPVDVFIRTNDRTVLSYLIKPIVDHSARVFREE